MIGLKTTTERYYVSMNHLLCICCVVKIQTHTLLFVTMPIKGMTDSSGDILVYVTVYVEIGHLSKKKFKVSYVL